MLYNFGLFIVIIYYIIINPSKSLKDRVSDLSEAALYIISKLSTLLTVQRWYVSLQIHSQ